MRSCVLGSARGCCSVRCMHVGRMRACSQSMALRSRCMWGAAAAAGARQGRACSSRSRSLRKSTPAFRQRGSPEPPSSACIWKLRERSTLLSTRSRASVPAAAHSTQAHALDLSTCRTHAQSHARAPTHAPLNRLLPAAVLPLLLTLPTACMQDWPAQRSASPSRMHAGYKGNRCATHGRHACAAAACQAHAGYTGNGRAA
jgi:hypothetical protein